jgi:hypothetical protein
VNCAEVREQLPDHLLGTLTDVEGAPVRRHLRGCAACRAELSALEDGLSLFSQAAHHSVPPPELETRVITAIEEEWRDAETEQDLVSAGPAERRRRVPGAWLVAAAAVFALVVSLGWGAGLARRADRAAADAASYSRLLATLGGREFRVGGLHGTPGYDVSGSLIVYDSVLGRSWAAVFVRAPGSSGPMTATLTGSGGQELSFDPIRITDGEGNGWLVTRADVRAFDRLTVRDASGVAVASAQIASV